MGFSEFVYPGATHTRFAHVLGAMQMARRMLDAFEKAYIFKGNAEHAKMRKATIAAALLHDIGHGPYSHVFEEISSSLNIDEEHEAITRKIVEETEIKDILEQQGIIDEVVKFFSEEPGYSPYTTIISSQMDCDRLDFLARDRYHTGIQSSAIDLAWLFDSLRIEEVPIDPIKGQKEFSFVVLEKGIGSAEEFVISYMKMYKEVYFHKTTRAVQHVVRDCLREFVTSNADSEIAKSQKIFRYFLEKGSRDLDNYLQLDDTSIIHALHSISEGKFGSATSLAKRYFSRDLYKCLELPASNSGAVKSNLAMKFVDALKNEKIDFVPDVIPAKSYKQYAVMEKNFLKNILIKKDGEPQSLGEVSNIVKSLGEKSARLYFKSDDDRSKAIELLKKCQSA
ncbi:MAG: HD domain-containing protein [Rhizobiales bacterium]|nr:HD domain-containing protein [Hyphomicrobiales bacterium]